VPDPRRKRRARLLGLLARHKADAIVITHLPNVRYLSGFSGSNAILLVTARRTVLYTDPRYDIQAREQCDCAVKVGSGPLWPELALELRRRPVTHLALEADRLSHQQWLDVAKLLGKTVKLVRTSALADGLRAVKSADEIDAIRRSVVLNSKAYAQALKRFKRGMSEVELAAEIDYRMRRLGAGGVAFDTIVASGARSALPHAQPTAARIEEGILLVDMGASVDGYASDMTRVAHVGDPSEKARELFDAVLAAQLASVAAVRPGATCAEVDAAGRELLKERGLDRFFTHSTGHGLGLEIHEAPRVGTRSLTRLETGMVITIEPGVYLEGFGGIRIEDTVLVTEAGVEVLTPTKKEFVVLPS